MLVRYWGVRYWGVRYWGVRYWGGYWGVRYKEVTSQIIPQIVLTPVRYKFMMTDGRRREEYRTWHDYNMKRTKTVNSEERLKCETPH